MAPLAPQHPHTWHAVAGDRQDPWAYLKDPAHPDTIPYLNAENAHSNAWFDSHSDLTEEIFQEIKSRTNLPTKPSCSTKSSRGVHSNSQ